ncbi:MAG: signal transduction histidine kinase/CheY-like chemotaxis protein [Maribacter sp.]|jgi:signal transduction histidine kinase/CheY-like chemotaxis protein
MKSIKSLFQFFCFVLLLCLSHAVEANNIDIEKLEKLKENSSRLEKVIILNQLSELYWKSKQIGLAKSTAIEAKELAKSLGDQSGQAFAFNNLGKVYQTKNDEENAMESYFLALEIFKAENNEQGIATANNNIGEVFLLKEEALKAIEKFLKAQTLMEKLGDDKGIAIVLNNLGEAFLKKDVPEYGPAKDYFSRSFQKKLEADDTKGAAKTARKIAEYDIQLKDYESAMIYLRATMGTYQDMGDQVNIAEVYHTMGEVYRLQNFPEDAISLYQNALTIREELRDSVGMANTYKSIGINAIALDNKVDARSYFESAIEIISNIPIQKGIPLIYKGISDGYEKLGDVDASLTYYKEYAKAKDSYNSLEKQKATLDLATMYASKFETEDIKNSNERLQLEQTNIKTTRNFLFAVFGLALLLLGVLYKSFISKKKDNQVLSSQNEKIAKMNTEIQSKNASLDSLNGKLVTEMAERESVEQSSFARDRFLATMSNEMRTPLNIISGLTHLLLTNDPRKDQVENLRTLQFSANNLVVFINDVLDFSNIEAGKISFDNIDFNPKDTFDEINERFSLPAKDKGIKLDFSYDSKLPQKLNGDPTRLNQIITNLLGTALKYTDEGEVSISVSVHELVKNKLTMLVSVKDSGNGIEKEKLEAMFKKFSRTAEDMYDGYGSSGLGLAISKRLVDLQNGKIAAKSTLGEGTEFLVYLPYTLVENKKKIVEDGKKNYEGLAGHKILLVEDNRINQLVVAKMLKKLGMIVVTADNGQKALEELGNAYYDLILMDIQMPIMDGYRATAEIRKSPDPRVRDIPIIALTASAYLTEKEKAKLFGMDDHVGKPFGPSDLLDKINYHIKLNEEVVM